MNETERYQNKIFEMDTAIVLGEMCILRGIKKQADVPKDFEKAARTLADNCRLLRMSYQEMLSGNKDGFEKVIVEITKANYAVSPTLSGISKKWNANWLQDYLKLLGPNTKNCADAAIAERAALEKILLTDKTLGRWKFIKIGKLRNGKWFVAKLPRKKKYPSPFSPAGNLSETRYSNCKQYMEDGLKKHGLTIPFLANYLASYLLDAPLYAYEAMLLKENNATPI